MDLESITRELQEFPALKRTVDLLNRVLDDGQLKEAPGSRSVAFYATLINKVLPSLESDLSREQVVVRLFSSIAGLNGIVSRIRAIISSFSGTNERHGGDYYDKQASYAQLNLLCHVLAHVIEDSNSFSRVWKEVDGLPALKQRVAVREIVNLYGGSTIVNSLLEARHFISQHELQLSQTEKDRFAEWEPLSDPNSFASLVTGQLLRVVKQGVREDSLPSAGSIVFKLANTVHSPQGLGAVLINKQNLETTISVVNRLGDMERRKIVIDIVLRYLDSEYLQDVNGLANAALVSSLASILSLFTMADGDVQKMVIQCLNSSINLKRVVALTCVARGNGTSEKAFAGLIERWGDELTVKKTPIASQEGLTQFIFLLMPHLSQEFLRKSAASKAYLDGVSNRLSSTSDKARLFGTLVAEKLSLAAPEGGVKPLNFDLKGFYDDDQVFYKDTLANLGDQVVRYDDTIIETLDQSQGSNLQPELVPSAGEHTKSTESNAASDANIFDAEDSDNEEEFMPVKKAPNTPVYIKDIMEYLSSEDYDKTKLAIDHAADLIYRKAKYGQELEFHAKALAALLAGLKDTFEIDDFNNKRLEALAQLVASSPKLVPPYLTQLLFEGDYSLQQRLVILSSLALGARKLALSTEPEPFATKQLPGAIDKLFREHGKLPPEVLPINSIVLDQNRNMLQDAGDAAREELIGGPQVVRVSRKLELDRQKQQRQMTGGGKTRSTHNPFAKLASRYFVFPLTGRFFAAGGISGMGQYSDILLGHFLKTVALMLRAGYPTSPDLVDMTTEVLSIVKTQLRNKDPVVLDGILTAILVSIDIHDSSFFVSKWPREAVELQQWLQDTWDDIIDDQVRPLAAGVLYKLNELTEQNQRLLIGQLTGIETRFGDLRLENANHEIAYR
uniref:ARAD1B04444p n=1 Tax=Blastobotrys adeninivorans TaxID=409370 RepID=A0A060TAZ5_BLAAD